MHFRNKLTKRKDWYILKDLYNGTLFKSFFDQNAKGTPKAFERHDLRTRLGQTSAKVPMSVCM